MKFITSVALLAATATAAPHFSDFKLRTHSTDPKASNLTLAFGSSSASHSQTFIDLTSDHDKGALFLWENGTLAVPENHGKEVVALAPLFGDAPKSEVLIVQDPKRAVHTVGISSKGRVGITNDYFGGWLACENTLSYLKNHATVPGDCSVVDVYVSPIQ